MQMMEPDALQAGIYRMRVRRPDTRFYGVDLNSGDYVNIDSRDAVAGEQLRKAMAMTSPLSGKLRLEAITDKPVRRTQT